MSQENVKPPRGVRYRVALPSEAAGRRRTLDERLFVRFPGLYHLLADRLMRLPPGSRLRRWFVTNSVSRGCAAANRRDFDLMLTGWADDIDYRAAEGALDDHGPIHGKAEMRAYVQDWLDTFDNMKVEPLEVIDAGQDQVIAVLRSSGRAKLSGVETDITFAALYTIRDGKTARGREYLTKEQALEAAGLRE
jgi:ketosteroid isomerase-like protein